VITGDKDIPEDFDYWVASASLPDRLEIDPFFDSPYRSGAIRRPWRFCAPSWRTSSVSGPWFRSPATSAWVCAGRAAPGTDRQWSFS
jgi:hypothetical protein